MSKKPRLDGVVVLVVDDDPSSLYLVEQVLLQQGASVVTAENPTAALRAVEKSPPDVLLSDIGLPEMDGYALLKKIRELEQQKRINAHVPAVAITAFTGPADRQQAILAGFRFHLPKPLDVDELLTTVAHLAGRTEGGSSGDQA
jgi:CheY-like chemotaxis protein